MNAKFFLMAALGLSMSFSAFSQWNNTGDNQTTGNLKVGGTITSKRLEAKNGDAVITNELNGLRIDTHLTPNLVFNSRMKGFTSTILQDAAKGSLLFNVGDKKVIELTTDGKTLIPDLNVAKATLRSGDAVITNELYGLRIDTHLTPNLVFNSRMKGFTSTILQDAAKGSLLFNVGDKKVIELTTDGKTLIPDLNVAKATLRSGDAVITNELNGLRIDTHLTPNLVFNSRMKGFTSTILQDAAKGSLLFNVGDKKVIELTTDGKAISNKLVVNDTLQAKKIVAENLQAKNIVAQDIKVQILNGADYVFDADYELKSLSEVESFITTNKHLPGIQSERDMQENGLNMNQFQIQLLQKVEELTLYIIQQNKRIEELENTLSNK